MPIARRPTAAPCQRSGRCSAARDFPIGVIFDAEGWHSARIGATVRSYVTGHVAVYRAPTIQATGPAEGRIAGTNLWRSAIPTGRCLSVR